MLNIEYVFHVCGDVERSTITSMKRKRKMKTNRAQHSTLNRENFPFLCCAHRKEMCIPKNVRPK